MDKAILPECYADTLLIQTLVPTYTGYNHKHSCYKVEGEMKFGKLNNGFAVGIIDKDKRTINYLEQFDLIDECPDFLKLHKHKEKHHYIVQLYPAVETWILEVCRLGNIDIKTYNLPDTLDGLKDITKHQSKLSETPELSTLFQHLRTRTDLEPVRKLIHWITTL